MSVSFDGMDLTPYMSALDDDIKALAALTSRPYAIDDTPGSPLANLQRWYDAPGRD